MKKNKIFSFKYLLHDFVRITGIPGLIWFRPKKIYISERAKKKHKGGVLFISNHNTLFDPMYIMLGIWYRRHHFVATKELFSNKFNKFLFTYPFICIPIDRENFSFLTFKEIVNHLQNGEAVTMFPEGKVNEEDSGINKFKSGMIMMALKGGVPIVPLYIKRRKNIFSRLVIGVGEAVDVNKIHGKNDNSKPTLKDIDFLSEYLYEQEKRLEEIVEKR